ncbi:hypothetical protein [Vibrio agarilyticus]|uniref:hypothetical protein n=1 Tax=Vibrio agarilyticus TaxID=2726741 RepID=UPI001FE35D57|nr:hypothetical protein [Vibrio agarilyticus]
MAKVYCSMCKKHTPHKVVMRRCKPEVTSVTAQLSHFAHMVGKFVSGTHYYDMEPQHFCRCCNQQTQNVALSKRDLATVIAQPNPLLPHSRG